ncbi:MAG: MarR family transcriptional regulator [Alphaproteobacteria bacterium]|nr:MarR family transcriptional regulator [Alphaproteobacteria bacterium]
MSHGLPLSTLMLELPQLMERLHRRFLDVVRLEMTRVGIRDINPVQIMMLATIGSQDMAVRDLIERGYYLGSNASYNIKNLAEGGYIERLTDEHDRRSARVRMTPKGQKVIDQLNVLGDKIGKDLLPGDKDREDYQISLKLLRRFERECSTLIHASE